MSEDFKTAKPALARLHQDIEAINHSAKPSYLGLIEQLECVLSARVHERIGVARYVQWVPVDSA